MKKKDLWRIGWCACPGCGSWTVGRGLICEICEGDLLKRSRPAGDITAEGAHRFLLDWIPGADDVLSNLILALKGRGGGEAWSAWARVFIQAHADGIFSLRNRVICAAPAKGAREDHSSLFARALADQLGLPYSGRPLVKTSAVSSRGLSPAQRFTRNDLVKNTDFRVRPESKIIFVDDVLTTGATARAVRQALGSPVGFEVWTLAARTRVSCEASDPMIGN